jgi:hypothetical protein
MMTYQMRRSRRRMLGMMMRIRQSRLGIPQKMYWLEREVRRK